MQSSNDIIRAGLRASVAKAIESSGVFMTPDQVRAIEMAVTREAAPVVLNQTNNEPWYRSRVTWGALGAIVLPLLGFAGVSADFVTVDEFVAGGLTLGTVASGALTLYGRWKARKPIGG